MRRHPATRIMGRLRNRIPDGIPDSAHDGLPVSHRLLRHTYASLTGR